MDAEGRQVVYRQREGQREEPRGDLFQDEQVGEEGLADAPEALLVGDAAQPHCAELAEQVPGELVLLLETRRGRGGPVPHELPDGVDDFALLVGQAEVTVHRAEA